MTTLKRSLAVTAVLLSPVAANALPLEIGDDFIVNNSVNGVPFSTHSGIVAGGLDVDLAGYDLFLNEGPDGLDWYVQSNGDFCGWRCGGQAIDFVVSGLDFAGSFEIVNFFSDFATGTFAVLSDTSFSFSWTNDGTGTSAVRGQQFIGGTFRAVTPVTPVPEPGILALLGLGLASVGMGRRNKKKA